MNDYREFCVLIVTGGAIYVAVTYTAFTDQSRTAWYEITSICSGSSLLYECKVASLLF